MKRVHALSVQSMWHTQFSFFGTLVVPKMEGYFEMSLRKGATVLSVSSEIIVGLDTGWPGL